MMTPLPQPSVRRSLIVTRGSLADQIGHILERQLQSPEAPAAAMRVVAAGDGDLATTLPVALHQISRTVVPAELAADGWQLIRSDELVLVLVCDAGDATPTWPLEAQGLVATQAAQLLGASVVTLLVWLAPGGLSAALRASLLATEAAAVSFPLGVLVQGTVTVDGLCLEDEQALATVVGVALEAILTTPLQYLPDMIMTAQLHVPEMLRFGTLGAATWQWHPARILPLLSERMERHILKQWQQPADPLHPETVAAWMTGHALSPDMLLSQAAAVPLPTADPEWGASWQMPKPWHLSDLWATMQAVADLDRTALQPYQNRQSWPLQDLVTSARGHLHNHLSTLLYSQPVHGLNLAKAWAVIAEQLGDEWVGQLVMQQDHLDSVKGQLAEERGLLHAAWQEQIDLWPETRWRVWRWELLRPWRWPLLVWRYRRLCQIGQQVQRLLGRQAVMRRQTARLQWVIQVMSEWQRLAREAWGLVDEVAAMVGHLLRSRTPIETGLTGEEAAMLDLLYTNILESHPDAAADGAAAVGGLGSYFNDPDDTRLQMQLSAFTADLVSPAGKIPALSLLQQLHAHPGEWEQWWQAFWDAAAPLWRYDSTRLSESSRTDRGQYACLCAAGATSLPPLPSPDGQGNAPVTTVDMADTRQLTLLRWHGHLSAAAMLREEEANEHV